MRGYDASVIIRAYRALSNATAPIVVFSAMPNIEDHAARLGAAGWISKPFELGDLIPTVNEVLPLRTTAA